MYIDIQYHYIYDKIAKTRIDVQYILISEMIVDRIIIVFT